MKAPARFFKKRPPVLVMASTLCLLSLTASCPFSGKAHIFRASWPEGVVRAWVGPEFWANRLQDWRVAQGRLECLEGSSEKPMRTVHLLTRSLGGEKGDFRLKVLTGLLEAEPEVIPEDAASGFLVGTGPDLDYRAAAMVHHSPGPGGGLVAAMDGRGRAVFRDMSVEGMPLLAAGTFPEHVPVSAEIMLEAAPRGSDYELNLEVKDVVSGSTVSRARLDMVTPERLVGSMALVSHPGTAGEEPLEHPVRFWFEGWEIKGKKIRVHEERRCGPVLSTQYTLSRGILKLTAQMMPLGVEDTPTARLETLNQGEWTPVAEATINPDGFTASFRVEHWDGTRDVAFRVVYDLVTKGGRTTPYIWSGTIRREPSREKTFVLAAFTGNHNVRRGGVDRGFFEWNRNGCWFPHRELVDSVARHDPDMLFFSGDQVYEGASPTRAEVHPLDYLYKWYLWCWAFRDLTRDRPCVCIPDDHDVYQGNLWGAGGRKADRQDDGGYTRPPDFVNLVQRTQTSHLPDPFDPKPVAQGIEVYYCALNYGPLSFAVLEDRKFKSSPTALVPDGQVVNGWFQNPAFNPAESADVPGAALLGKRQLDFLRQWSSDWSHGAEMKVVLSQTLFSNVATIPAGAKNGSVLPRTRIFSPEEYPADWKLAADADSNAWPQAGRNMALREMRRGLALHVCGDQHLGSTIQYGIDDWRDGPFALCVPSIANFWPRRWYPPHPGGNRSEGAPLYTGDYRDGFGNRMTVFAVSNPTVTGRTPSSLYDQAPGYGIARFDVERRKITLECWPRWANPADPASKPYPGWPITVSQTDNGLPNTGLFLPALLVQGLSNPVIQVVDENDGRVVYSLRIRGTSFRPPVFQPGTYTVRVGDPDGKGFKVLEGLKTLSKGKEETRVVSFKTRS